MSTVLIDDPVRQEAIVPCHMPKPELPARTLVTIDVVADQVDLENVEDLPCLGGDIVWRLVRSVGECFGSATWIVVVWSDASSSRRIPLPFNAIVLCRSHDQRRRARRVYPSCTTMIVEGCVQRTLHNLIPLLSISCNYEGLICVDIMDVMGLLEMGCDIQFMSRRLNGAGDLTEGSVEWRCVGSDMFSAMHAGLYMNENVLFDESGAYSKLDRWISDKHQRIGFRGEDVATDIFWCGWHGDMESYEYLYMFSIG